MASILIEQLRVEADEREPDTTEDVRVISFLRAAADALEAVERENDEAVRLLRAIDIADEGDHCYRSPPGSPPCGCPGCAVPAFLATLSQPRTEPGRTEAGE